MELAAALALAPTLARVSDNPRLDVELLLEQVTGLSRAGLLARPRRRLNRSQVQCFQTALARRRDGEPLAYILGRWGFYGLELAVNPAVLVPRPETELLVDWALERAPAGPLTVVDLGTGSGAIAIALAHHRPAWRVLGTDVSPEALALARANGRGLVNLDWLLADWCQGLADSCCDLLLANPPYLRADDPHLTRGGLPFEPRPALVARGGVGLGDIQRIAGAARRVLRPGGLLILEQGFDQAAVVAALLHRRGFAGIEGRCDGAGHGRASLGCNPPT